MPAIHTAHSRATSPVRAFSVSLKSAGQHLVYTAFARSSGEAMDDALTFGYVTPPVAASVKPIGTHAEAMRVFRLKLALAHLVE